MPAEVFLVRDNRLAEFGQRQPASLVCLVTAPVVTLLKCAQSVVEARYGRYFKVARTFVKVIGNPAVMRELTRVGMHSHTLMEWVLRIMANLLRPDELGPAEAAYRAVATIARIVPERVPA